MQHLDMIPRFHKTNLIFFLISLCVLAFNAFAASTAAQTENEWRFGVIEAYEAPFSARNLGVGWTRTTFQWADVQPEGPEAWQPPVTDEVLETEARLGREMVGLLIGIPEWARDENNLPAGLWLPHDDRENLWATFVREAVGQYNGRIDHWIIWNEPDINKTEIAHTWDGSVADFAQLQRVAYLAAKEVNPNVSIHLAAFTYWADVQAGREQYMARLLDELLADPDAVQHDYYFDAATAHLYFQADQVYDLILFFRQIMLARGINKPIWLVETNAPPYDDPAWPVENVTLAVTQDEQAAFVPQAVVAALAAGAERVGVFKMQDTVADRAANPEPFGLMRMDVTTRLAYRTYATAIDYLAGATHVERMRWDAVGQFLIEQPDRTTTAVFSRLPEQQQVNIAATAESALLVDMWGQKKFVSPQNGVYTLELQQARCTQTIGDFCMIGGTMMYLIEAKDGGPPPEDLPAPLISAPPTLTPLPSVTPAPTTPAPTATRMSPIQPTGASTMQPTATATLPSTSTVTATAVSFPSHTPRPETQPVTNSPPDWNLAIIGFVIVFFLSLAFWRWQKKRKQM